MELLFFRHGPAGDKEAWKPRPDDERPLTTDGLRKTANAAAGLAKLAEVRVIAASPLSRAMQTADILARAFPKAKRQTWEELRPEGDAARLLKRAGGIENLVLVGHEPALSAAIAAALSAPRLRLDLKKAGACAIDLKEKRLLWLMKPSQLRALR